MLEHREWATGGDPDAGQAPPLPDLTAVDLRTLRDMDHPELVAAVDRVLGRSRDLGESWVSEGNP
ncbi:hypothetical protein ACF06X_21410 [Streptomyces sp. NPDC015346]|uniref:hypothetical protein n=1 Tax=Streptomyces sp. NPDC015346 TaxID=3364954 RepID=UPI0036FAC250